MSDAPDQPRTITMPRRVTLATVALTVLLIAWQSPVTLLILVVDGAPAVAIVAIVALAGTWIVPVLRLGALPPRWQLLIGTGVGLGVLPAFVLASGLAGLLDRTYWLVVLGMLAVAAVGASVRLKRVYDDRPPTECAGRFAWMLLLVTPFLAMSLLVTVVPPGFLWTEEGGGYDVLEYHLELPKEYAQQGHIAYTPHNVYGNFPANVEMLYLLCTVLRDDPYAGAATAKVLNVLLAAACVFGAYVGGRDVSPRVGVATVVIAASVGWLTYLSGVAYVENGMLMFTMIAIACVIRSLSDRRSHVWLVLAGLNVGFACGCKYTAILLCAVPLALTVLLASEERRLRRTALLVASALVAFAPWLLKNFAMTGNPVFPLANTLFEASPEGWGVPESRHFDACHQLSHEESSLADRLRTAWRRIPADPGQRFGVSLFLLAALRLYSRRRNRVDAALLILLAAQLAGWLFFTHLYARFAVPLVLPLVLLAGRSVDANARRIPTIAMIAGVALSAFFTARCYVEHLYHEGEKLPLAGAEMFFLNGTGGGHEHLAVINSDLSADAKILMIGDAKAFYFQRDVDYCVVFNRNPFIEAVREAGHDSDVIDWLRERGYTHLLVNWAEVSRLRGSRYGFADEIQPALFDRLTGWGLDRVETFASGSPARPYAVLYRVSR